MLKISEITPEILQLKFLDDEELILHFMRFSSFYESADPKLFRKKFSFDEVLDSYKKSTNNEYFKEIVAFNVPASMVNKMANEYGDALTAREKLVVSILNMLKTKNGNNIKYLIGTCGTDDEIDEIQHELCHGFYYTDEAYKMRMDGATRFLPRVVKQELYKYLKKTGYHQSVMDDELQAYMATGFDDEEGINTKLIHMFRSPFIDIFLEALSTHELL